MAAPAPVQEAEELEDSEADQQQQQNEESLSDLNSTRSLALDQLHLNHLNEQREEELKRQEEELYLKAEQSQERIDKLAAGRTILQEATKRSAKGMTPEEKDTIALEYIETTLDKCASDGTLNQIALDAHIEGVLRSRNLLAILLDGRKAAPAPPKSNIPHLMQQQQVLAKQLPPRLLHSSPVLRSALLRAIAQLPPNQTYNPAVRSEPVAAGSSYYLTIYDSFLKCVRSWQAKPINAEGEQFLTNLLTGLLKTEASSTHNLFFPLPQLAELIFIDKSNRLRYMRYYTLVMTLGITTRWRHFKKKHNDRQHMMNWNLEGLAMDQGVNKYKFTVIHILFKSCQIDALIDWLLLIPPCAMCRMDLKQFTSFTMDHQKTLKMDAEYTAAKTTTTIGGYKITLIQRLCAYIILALFDWQSNHRFAFTMNSNNVPSKVRLVIDSQCHVALPYFSHHDSLHDFLRKMREYVEKNRVKLEFTPYDAIVPASHEAAALLALSDASRSSSSASSTSSSAAASSSSSSK